MDFFSFATPKSFTESSPRPISAFKMMRVINTAVNMDRIIPSASVCAKPLIGPVPRSPSTIAAIRVVILPSMIAERALLKPIFTEEATVFPVASSSRILAKMITLASTAIPMPRMIPAIPGKVNVIPKDPSRITTSSTYIPSASTAAKPGRK